MLRCDTDLDWHPQRKSLSFANGRHCNSNGDPEKAAFNEKKHGVTFVAAARVFDDPFANEGLDDTMDYDEERIITVGMVGSVIFVVVWTERRGGIRLISARRATRWKANEYFENR